MSAHGGRGRRGGAHEEEHENAERWAVSYADMITVLMALFIVLFAISQVDQQKFIALRDSLSAGFNPGSNKQSVLDGTDGTQNGLTSQTNAQVGTSTAGLVQADAGNGQQAASPTPTAVASDDATTAAAKTELSHMDQLEAQMKAALAAQGLADQASFRITSRGLVVGLVANDVFFAAESATLTPTAAQVLDALAPTLGALTEDLSIEGHANVLPTTGQYASNWELSSDRATKVLRYLVESEHISGDRVQAVGFGDTRPLQVGTDAAALAANRRVDIVILSSAPESVRALLPTLAAGQQP